MKYYGALLLLILSLSLQAQVKVTFKITGLPAGTPLNSVLYLAGSFNGWSPANAKWQLVKTNGGAYLIKTELAKGSYEYKITRGSWATAECAKNGTGIANRNAKLQRDTTILITVADWQDKHPMEKQHTLSKNVQILSDNFEIPQLGRKRRIWIYLPEGYQTSGKKYAVLYMHDGQNLFDDYTAGFGEWGVDEFLDKLGSEQKQLIVVGIDHGGENRITEYDPYDSEYGKGRGDDYARFLVETLKPFIDSHYPTFTDARHTAIAGSSMGGLISMYTALKYPEVFGSAGIFSPAFWIGQPVYEFAKTKAISSSRYYFVCGDQESDKETNDMTGMVNILKEKGLPPDHIPSVIVNGAKHNEQQWKGDFPAFYEWLVSTF
jgi:predicted alpha/beta superfamily hydrolase